MRTPGIPPHPSDVAVPHATSILPHSSISNDIGPADPPLSGGVEHWTNAKRCTPVSPSTANIVGQSSKDRTGLPASRPVAQIEVTTIPFLQDKSLEVTGHAASRPVAQDERPQSEVVWDGCVIRLLGVALGEFFCEDGIPPAPSNALTLAGDWFSS